MVEIGTLVVAAIAIAVALISYKLFKSVVKAVLIVSALVSLVMGVATFFVIMDSRDLQENLAPGPNLMMMIDNNEVISAIEFTSENEAEVMKTEDLVRFTKELEAEQYDAIGPRYYKLIIFQIEILDDMEGDFEVQGRNYTRSELDDFIKDGTNADRADIFLPIFEKTFSDPLFLIKQYKKGNVVVHEETALFTAIKYVPTSIAKPVIERTTEPADT